MALMYNRPRPATVQARTAGSLWRLHRRAFHRFQHERLEAEFETGQLDQVYAPPDKYRLCPYMVINHIIQGPRLQVLGDM